MCQSLDPQPASLTVPTGSSLPHDWERLQIYKHEVPPVIPLVIMKRRAVDLPNLLKYQLVIQRSLLIVGATCVWLVSRSREMIKITLITPLRAVARPDRAAVIPTEKDGDSAKDVRVFIYML